jgi:hypothetical protein
MCLKWREEVTNALAQVNLINDDFGMAFELFLFVINIKKEVCDVLESLCFLKRRYKKKKSHNMLFLMLDPKLQNLCLIYNLYWS